VRAGATNVYGPDFGVSNADALYRDALGLAIADARAKAERMAGDAGVTLGPVLRIREGFTDFDEGASLQAGDGGERTSATTIAPGRTRIAAVVTVTYAVS
jgi:uncharacterized protein YggE